MLRATYRRGRGVVERRVGSGLFLAHPGNGGVFRANPTFAAVWMALQRPRTGTALLRLFRQAFPRVAARRMRLEVEIMLRDLVAAGLIHRRAARPAR